MSRPQVRVDEEALLALVVQWQDSYRVNEAAKKDNSPRERMYHVHANVGATFQHCAIGLGRALGLRGNAADSVRAVVLTEDGADELDEALFSVWDGESLITSDTLREVIRYLIVSREGRDHG